MNRLAFGSAFVLCLGLSGCASGSHNSLTLQGSYTGETAGSSCSVGVYDAGTYKLVESHVGDSHFELEYAVERGRYYVEIHCGDGKYGTSPPFAFEPPRARVTLTNIELR